MICEARAPVFEPVFKDSAMQPGGHHHQQTNGYEYDDYQSYSQPPTPASGGEARPSVPSMRPTLDAPAYYPPQGMLPSPYTPQHSFYQPSRTPVAISQFPYAESPLEHKPPTGYQRAEPLPLERMCDVCQHPDPVLVAPNCNHTFHSRCVHAWPLDACPACAAPLEQVAISGSVNMMAQPAPRSGKWTRPEEVFIDGILREFDRQALPLAHGTPIRLVLAKLLNCSTMRLSKKFQKNALGKRTFRVSKPARGEKALQFDQMDHTRRQREFSRLEQAFRQELVDQFRRENNTDEGALVETQNLRCAVQQFWVSNFLKFAILVGQPVVGLDVSDAKKRKHALQLLRNAKYDELLSPWSHHHPSPANTASVTPMPPIMATPSGDVHNATSSWSSGAPVYSATNLGHQDNGPSLLQQIDRRPAKKMRTPEGSVEVNRYGLQVSTMDQSASAFPHYERLSPPPAAASPFDYSQQQTQQQYSPESYVRPSTSYYSDVKAEKPGLGYASVHQQQQQQMPSTLVDNEPIAHSERSGLAPTTYQAGSGAYHASSAGVPWDDLLENVPASASNTNAGGSAQPASQGPPYQNWSNNPHMM